MNKTAAPLSAALLVALAVTIPARAEPAGTETVDLLLVLAADVSRSINDEEFDLQRKGYAAALTDPKVLAAITGGAFYTILRKEPNKQAVWDYLAFATSDEWQRRWIEVEVQVPGIAIEPIDLVPNLQQLRAVPHDDAELGQDRFDVERLRFGVLVRHVAHV